ncbi:glycosyltransferase [Xenococcus sp. PCC 7305]|uniref:glycosyltransferase n=1 Tax=Xenococcus sp. PCC 7305 TaxID=102125 RepID=UPI0002E2DFE1|nr:glycosyltransferase [Xenococcus sp. PCC 7305]
MSLLIWLFLLLFWGQFWRGQVNLDLCYPLVANEQDTYNQQYPNVWAIVPARNEAEVISDSLSSLLKQNYPGEFNIVLVDDQSSDQTIPVAQETTQNLNCLDKLHIAKGKNLPAGWKGKIWAIAQGVDYISAQNIKPDYFLLTDGDIQHDQHNLQKLVGFAEVKQLDLVSLMVLLRCQSFWEKLLIPAFVFFFEKLYPFDWVNNPQKSIAAAAGGCILIRRQTLETIGGIAAIKDALIDDCSLAQKVKAQNYKIWLGLTSTNISLRPYDDLKSIWDMVARSAYTQLDYSVWLLITAVIGMIILYLSSPIALIIGIIYQSFAIACFGMGIWLLMAIAYFPTIKLYQLSPWWCFTLPVIAFLYVLMTVDSARKHWLGQGENWKGRIYQKSD